MGFLVENTFFLLLISLIPEEEEGGGGPGYPGAPGYRATGP